MKSARIVLVKSIVLFAQLTSIVFLDMTIGEHHLNDQTTLINQPFHRLDSPFAVEAL